jgi:hypothetical protein
MFPELPEAKMEMRRLIGFCPLGAAERAAKLISG